ncbi:MAG: DUF1298 domain-containing protein [Acidimicrobiales bacterium]|nr:DUF1298 domain-containing protein [Acidimicrobiales bacterium]
MPDRELRFERSMTDAEALMWSIERDPWLSPSGASITLFDRPIDFTRFRRLMSSAVAAVPRLRQHVVAPAAPLAPPRWETDHELDLDWHVRRVGAPGSGSLDDLLEWMALFMQDPYDRSRPLWQYVVIDGIEGGLGAIASKLHHVVIDGQGAVRLAEAYVAVERDAPDPPEVDLAAALAADREAPPGVVDGARDLVAGALRLPTSAGRSVVDALTHPQRLLSARQEAESLARATRDQLHPAGSTLWQARSRRRRVEALSMPYDAAHDAARALGGTLNDLFVAGAVDAGVRYHEALGAEVERFHLTFVVSTRAGDDGATNAFTPIPVDVPAGRMDPRNRFAVIRDLLHARRGDVHGSGPMATVAALANLIPTAVVTSTIRSQAAHIDFATSNLPGYLGDTYVAGARTLHTYVFGPVAGTACNLTLFTTAGSVDIGVHADPAAITDTALLRRCLDDAYADLLAG